MKLNMENKLFSDPRFLHFVTLLNGNYPVAFGVLGMLWKFSQSEMQVYCSKEEAIAWMVCGKAGEEIFDHLVESKWLTFDQDRDLFRIHGNEKKIESAVKAMIRSRKNGEAVRKQWEALKNRSLNKPIVQDSADDPIADKELEPTPEVEQKKLEKSSKNNDKEQPKQSRKVPLKWQEKISEFDQSVAKEWMSFAKEVVPYGRFDELQFQVAIVKMREIYKLDHPKIKQLLSWCQESNFWRDKSYSPVGLLKQKGEKANLDTILLNMSAKLNSSKYETEDPDMEYKRELIEKAREAQRKREAEAEAKGSKKWEFDAEGELIAV